MQKLYPYLTYAGVIPFMLCAVFLLLPIEARAWLPFFFSAKVALSTYALAIASFLAGSHWGQHFYLDGVWRISLPLASNAIVIVIWLGFLTLPSDSLLLALYVAAFALLLVIDQRLFRAGLITRHYFKTRCIITTLVIATLLVSILVLV